MKVRTVRITHFVTVEAEDDETWEETEAYVHDAVADWFSDGQEYETEVEMEEDA